MLFIVSMGLYFLRAKKKYEHTRTRCDALDLSEEVLYSTQHLTQEIYDERY